MTLEQYINMRIEWYERALEKSESLSKDAVFRNIYIAKESEALSVLYDIKAHMQYISE